MDMNAFKATFFDTDSQPNHLLKLAVVAGERRWLTRTSHGWKIVTVLTKGDAETRSTNSPQSSAMAGIAA